MAKAQNVMDMKGFMRLAKVLPPHVSILVRGPHGIGKSQAVYQWGKILDLPVVERRLSQMSEGDMIGLPKLEGNSTKFCPPDWFMKCTERPAIIFLDELNRAVQEVMQASFQLVLDRELNGVRVHDGCRIIAAVNDSSSYQVNEMDPALIDRFFVVDLVPTVDDWIAWAKTEEAGINWTMVDFIRQSEKSLEHTDRIEPGKVYPSRRSWHRVNQILSENKLWDEPNNIIFYQVVMGMCGVEEAIKFQEFAKNYGMVISADDVLNKLEKFKERLIGGSNEQKMAITEKIAAKLKKMSDEKKRLTEKQMANLVAYGGILPDELLMNAWQQISQAHFKDGLEFQKKMGERIMNAVGSADKVGSK